ncbi:hypothetical protein LshimejAT787_1301270 [Lyophyllum shimeji]|uniref:Uncharacterized protein n=1 Tax=Lyophyllum shimeji TaxID=47721 RepID=A0A9P3UUJ8_LYOSH|nr:hypothetical protein LshimejAT787_1301270 [Lyophyllum shimeji]
MYGWAIGKAPLDWTAGIEIVSLHCQHQTIWFRRCFAIPSDTSFASRASRCFMRAGWSNEPKLRSDESSRKGDSYHPGDTLG